jgi:nitrate/nitrite-specific signal transduction histidine kinase
MNRWSQIQHPTRRLTTLYITALSTVALLTVLGQVVIQSALQQQSSDALVINIAGRQRMLSQRLSKAALALAVFPDAQSRQQNANELQAVVALWQHSQQGLQHGDVTLGLPGHNSQAVQRLFASIEPEYKSMLEASNALLILVRPGGVRSRAAPSSALLPEIRVILAAQSGFLVGMDEIVTQYQREAEQHVARLKLIELILLSLTLLVLLLEGLFVFRPAVGQLRQTLSDLLLANERATREEVTRKRAERILALNDALAARQQNTPHARIIALDHYQVRDRDGSYHNVHRQEIAGQQVFICECQQYQQYKICSHSLAASTLHVVSS